jgi:hypothetical protein
MCASMGVQVRCFRNSTQRCGTPTPFVAAEDSTTRSGCSHADVCTWLCLCVAHDTLHLLLPRPSLTTPHPQVLSTGLGLLPDASGQLRVDYLVEGSPAAAAGDIHTGDVLLSVNSEPVAGKPLK